MTNQELIKELSEPTILRGKPFSRRLRLPISPAIDDVLWAFTVEPNHDKQTFENYLREYPAYAAELADLLHQLTRTDLKEKELTDKDRLRIDEAWRQFTAEQ